jgi:hypothetical protein
MVYLFNVTDVTVDLNQATDMLNIDEVLLTPQASPAFIMDSTLLSLEWDHDGIVDVRRSFSPLIVVYSK